MIKTDDFLAIIFQYLTKFFHKAKISVKKFLYFDSSNKQLIKIEDPQGVPLLIIGEIVCLNCCNNSLYLLVLLQNSHAISIIFMENHKWVLLRLSTTVIQFWYVAFITRHCDLIVSMFFTKFTMPSTLCFNISPTTF